MTDNYAKRLVDLHTMRTIPAEIVHTIGVDSGDQRANGDRSRSLGARSVGALSLGG